jgi:hypothetical protein
MTRPLPFSWSPHRMAFAAMQLFGKRCNYCFFWAFLVWPERPPFDAIVDRNWLKGVASLCVPGKACHGLCRHSRLRFAIRGL